MQPEPHRATQDSPDSTASLDPPDSSQHGLLRPDHAPSRLRSARGSDDGNALSPDGSSQSSLLELNATKEPLTAARRISEYESASIASSPRRPGEFGFKVIPSKGTGNGTTVENFPNEVLTHILSHLPPSDLSAMSLVSRRFHTLVTTPHAWRIAFSRYFPGPASLEVQDGEEPESEEYERILLQRRHFSRLTALASWRNEYILRTRLLRSLARGRPAEVPLPARSGSAPVQNPNPMTTYGSLLLYPVSHIDAKFGSGTEKKGPCFVHGASEQGSASVSEPMAGKVGTGSWGISDPQTFSHFGDQFPFASQWGLGEGELVGVPNVMDLSQQFGMVYGEGCPPLGRTYFLSAAEKRGRFLSTSDASPQRQLGIPKLSHLPSGVCSVWIAKSARVLELTGGICGILSGSSLGILTAYALGPHPSYNKRFERGQVTARWALCPGVPIISIKVDDNYSAKRQSQGRIWAVVLNALGEVFYLTDVPTQSDANPTTAEEVDQVAWATGRSVRWEQIESTRRVATPDPHNKILVDGSYSPRSSSASMGLTPDQVAAETKEIEEYLAFKPSHFRHVCQGWDMRRRLEIDFAGDDLHGAGESVIVVNCGTEEDTIASVRRFTRLKHRVALRGPTESFPQIQSLARPSLFGGVSTPELSEPLSRTSSAANDTQSQHFDVEWRTSDLLFNAPRVAEITASTMDVSTFSQLTVSEDPLLTIGGPSSASSSSPSHASSPSWQGGKPSLPSDIPGQRARFMALGTSNGVIYIWNVRAAVSQNAEITNRIDPLRVINTDSPQISSLAMTSLYLVHGGNDGLVQAWDPLASSTQPIRTLNSRFSSRARRHLAQAQASVQGVGNNYFAASAIALDLEPTNLRGVVALGTHLRYWAFSSSAADAYKSHKRKLRYTQRGNNTTSPDAQKYVNSGRGEIHDFILSERRWLEKDKAAREKESARLRGRFGTDLLGPNASDDDLLAYACMLSEEAYTSDEAKRRGSESSSSSGTITPIGLPNGSRGSPTTISSSVSVLEPVDEEMDPDVVEAIRRSLEDASVTPEYDFEREPSSSSSLPAELEFSDHLGGASSSSSTSPFHDPGTATQAESSASTRQEDSDLELAIRLSMAEQEILGTGNEVTTPPETVEEFPALGSGSGVGVANSPAKRRGKKGKGKGREIVW